jgi:predicted ester cyclase
MSTNARVALVGRFMDEVVLGRNSAVVDDLCSEDVVYRMPLGLAYGRSGVKTLFQKTFEAFPDCRIRPDYVVAEADHVAVRAIMRATFTGVFEDQPANGRRIALAQLWIFRIREHLIEEILVDYDTLLLGAALGVPLPRSQVS